MNLNIKKILSLCLLGWPLFGLVSCQDGSSSTTGEDRLGDLRFAYPDGTPVLAIATFGRDYVEIAGSKMTYSLVSASLIAQEMATNSAELVIMPINAGAKLIQLGADYELASVAVDGSLFIIGQEEINTIDSLKGKKVACIGQQGTPGLVSRYVLGQNEIAIVSEPSQLTANNIYLQYVADGAAARTLLAANSVDYAIVGEPAATALSAALAGQGIGIRLNMQEEYRKVVGTAVTTYPQAGLFVKSKVASNSIFMAELYEDLSASKNWVFQNPGAVTELVQKTLGSMSVFPVASITNCAINGEKMTREKSDEVDLFLTNVVPFYKKSKCLY